MTGISMSSSSVHRARSGSATDWGMAGVPQGLVEQRAPVVVLARPAGQALGDGIDVELVGVGVEVVVDRPEPSGDRSAVLEAAGQIRVADEVGPEVVAGRLVVVLPSELGVPTSAVRVVRQ